MQYCAVGSTSTQCGAMLVYRLPPSIQQYKPLNVRPGSMIQCYVAHVESPSLFYCQPVMSADELHELMESIEQYCAITPPMVFDQNKLQRLLQMPVVAKYSDDQKWYRAEVTGARATKVRNV